jgi:hypothetical protein
MIDRADGEHGKCNKTNASKREYCSRAPRTELTDTFQAHDFGTPISIGAGGVGRPKGMVRPVSSGT